MKSKLLTSYSICFVLLLSLIISGCDSDSSTKPNENQELINKLKAVTDSLIENTDLPGIVALVVDKTKGIDWVYEVGYSDLEQKLPMNKDYTFRIGSNTKTMTNTVLFQLIGEGKLSLEDTLSKFFPTFKEANKITITMLCNMSSGYFNYSEDTEYFGKTLEENPTKVWTPQELVNVSFLHDLYFEPGQDIHYSNTNTIILGMLIEKLTGNSLETEIQNRIITPLGLQKTKFLTFGLEFPGPHGKGYYTDNDEINTEVTNRYDVSWGWAAGSAYSTPRELQKYVEKLVAGGLLSDSLQNIRLTKHFIPDDGKNAYGLGIVHRGTFFGHNGGMPGFTSSMYHSNSKNCSIIIYFNCQKTGLIPDDLFLRYVDILYGNNY